MGPILETRRLEKMLGGRSILRGIDLTIERGARICVTGRSGSGKSTLLKLLAGLDRPSAGAILLEGEDLTARTDDELSEIRLRKLGLIFQSPHLLPDLDVESNVMLPLAFGGTPRPTARERVASLLKLVGLEAHRGKRPNELSGGEAQRVAIARALANGPSILIADEPTTGLDRANAENVMAIFDAIHRDLGGTIILATHDPLAIEHGGRRLDLDDGNATWRAVPPIR